MSLSAYIDEADQTDGAIVARIVARADTLARSILASEVPDIAEYRALAGLTAWANGSQWYTPSPDHQRALQCLPADQDLRLWMESERRLASVRGS